MRLRRVTRPENSGGIFGPSLFLGAMLGAGVGTIAHAAMPSLTADPGAYALVGMGAVFAGIIRVPLTSVFMIFELTRDYAIVVPLMISNLVSFIISRKFQAVPVYEALALQDGIHLPRPTRDRHAGPTVSKIMLRDVPVLDATSRIADVPRDARAVVVTADRTVAAFSRDEVSGVEADGPLAILLDDSTPYPHVHPDQAVEDALERMEDAGVSAIAVVDRADVTRVLGAVTLAQARGVFRSQRSLQTDQPSLPAG